MKTQLAMFGIAAALSVFPGYVDISLAASKDRGRHKNHLNVQVGPRPYFLVEDMDSEPLKTALQECSEKTLKKRPSQSVTAEQRYSFLSIPKSRTKRQRAWARGLSNAT